MNFACRTISLLALTASLHGCGSPTSTSDTVIIPGERVGPFRLYSTTEEGVFGQNTEVMQDKFTELGFYFTFEEEDKLTSVTVLNTNFVTDKGIKVGDPLTKVVEVYGSPTEESLPGSQGKSDTPALVYEGILFLIEKDSVAGITVIPTPPKKEE